MLTLVLGGSASGKSEYAEALLSGATQKVYIATMKPLDSECLLRIGKHRGQRAQKGFVTVERYIGLSELSLPKGCSVLLECMGNLVANEYFSPEGAGGQTVRRVLEGIRRLCSTAQELVVVSNDVFADGGCYDSETTAYLEALAQVNRELARRADRVVEVVCGIPIVHKGDMR